MRSGRLLAALAGLGLVVTLCSCAHGSSPISGDTSAAQSFLSALGDGDAKGAAALTDQPAQALAGIQDSLTGLGSDAHGTMLVTSVTARSETSSTANYSASWAFPSSSKAWNYDGTLAMTHTSAGWQVVWSIADVYPGLIAGQHLSTVLAPAARGQLLDSAGRPLTTEQAATVINVDPAQVVDVNTLAAVLGPLLDISSDAIATDVAGAKGKPVTVAVLASADVAPLRTKLETLRGVTLTATQLPLPPTSRFAQPVLGQLGPATQAIIDASSGHIVSGDIVGLSGLQASLNTQLAGTAGRTIYIDSSTGHVRRLLDISDPIAGRSTTLTLDRADQLAADAALDGVTQRATIVLTQPSTGKVLAVANSAGSTEDIGLAGHLPPGTAFELVSYAAALAGSSSLTAESPVSCLSPARIGGQVVTNPSGADQSSVPLSTAFARGCDTTAADLVSHLDSSALSDQATALGLGWNWVLPAASFSGQIGPVTDSAVGGSATATTSASAGSSATGSTVVSNSVGQGTVQVSPLLLAGIAGALSSGKPLSPSLVQGQQPTNSTALPKTLTTAMTALMRAAVTDPTGSAHSLADLPGSIGGVAGKAPYGTPALKLSHSWFVGVRGDLAVAVFVTDGGTANVPAVGIAAKLFAAVAPGS